MRWGCYLLVSTLFILVQFTSCAWKPVSGIYVAENDPSATTRRHSVKSGFPSERYIPWNGESQITPMRTIRVNFHFMNSRDSSKNLHGEAAIAFAQRLIEEANSDLGNNQPMRLPLGNHTPVLDPLIRYEIERRKDGSPAIYQHYDDDYYYLVKKGKFRNNHQTQVIDRYGAGTDSILNVFVQAPPPDSMMDENYGGLITGVALRNGIRISGPLTEDSRVYKYTGMFNHEVGHVLGLRHSWTRDQCDDTPEHTNCWNFTQNGSECDSLVSNNIMDSNADQNAFTPCQIGIMHQNLTEVGKRGRSYLKVDYCKKLSVAPIRIRDTVVWNREIDVISDIVIEKNSQLVIHSRLSMPQAGRIYIEKNGQLVLKNKAVIDNACGMRLDGVFVKSDRTDQLVIEEGASVILE